MKRSKTISKSVFLHTGEKIHKRNFKKEELEFENRSVAYIVLKASKSNSALMWYKEEPLKTQSCYAVSWLGQVLDRESHKDFRVNF